MLSIRAATKHFYLIGTSAQRESV